MIYLGKVTEETKGIDGFLPEAIPPLMFNY